MLSSCPVLSTSNHHHPVDSTVEPIYSRYMSNTNPAALDSLARTYFAARDAMYARNTAGTRAACQDAARAYDAAQDAAELDSTRNWAR
jgi:hypothetical protein